MKPNIFNVKKCSNCQSKALSWQCGVQNTGVCQDGQISMNEVKAVFFLGCDDCSETLKIVDFEKIVSYMNHLQKDSWQSFISCYGKW